MVRSNDYLKSLVHELIKMPQETGWVEFKHNNKDPQEIGEYISALSNTAAYDGKFHAYLVWGVDDRTHELIGTTLLRKEVLLYPELSVRELVANAIIHQDLTLTGTGPMIEIYNNRMEITNPGKPLVNPDRFLDSPPRSRNEALASFMRRAGICEERGSGFDKVVAQTEKYQLPPPTVEVTESHTKVTLYAPKTFDEMELDEKIHACYLHACLKYVSKEQLTNASLRARFGLDDKDNSKISRLIRDSVSAQKIKPLIPNTAPRYMKYIPFWV